MNLQLIGRQRRGRRPSDRTRPPAVRRAPVNAPTRGLVPGHASRGPEVLPTSTCPALLWFLVPGQPLITRTRCLRVKITPKHCAICSWQRRGHRAKEQIMPRQCDQRTAPQTIRRTARERRSCRDPHSGAARAPAVGPVPRPRRRRARHHLDPRRARGDARGIGRRRAEAKPGAALLRRGGRPRRQRLSDRRGARRALLRLADRPARPQEAVLHHHRRLSDGDRADRARRGTASRSSCSAS